MENNLDHTKKIAGYSAISGAVIMIIGAVLWGTSGTDLWNALDNNSIVNYLESSHFKSGQLIANLSFWISGVLILGLAGALMANLAQNHIPYSQIILICYRTAVPMVITSYIIMLSIIVQISPDVSESSLALTNTLGWIGVRLDDLSTALMIGVGPFFISLSGQKTWVPGWLLVWSYLTMILGLFSVIVLYLSNLRQLGFIIIPVGVTWMLAAGLVLLKNKK
jgi:hypothetical protein